MGPLLELLGVVATTLVAISSYLVTTLLMTVAFARIRRKGYSPMTAGMYFIFCAFVGLVSMMAPIAIEPTPVRLVLFMMALGGPAICVALAFAAARWLPRKPVRIFGPRKTRFPFEF